MNNLVFGMKYLTVTQLPGGSFSHANNAMDLAGVDSGIDFWFAQGRWKCIGGPWGNGTYFFIPVTNNGIVTEVHCADGVNRIVTLALTHSETKYIHTTVGKIYENGQAMYEEGVKGKATGNHIHLEIAAGIQSSKTYNSKLGVYTMQNELNPIKVMYINTNFTKIKQTLGASFKTCTQLQYVAPTPTPTPTPTPAPTPEGGKKPVYFYATKCSCNIRQKLTFSNGRNTSTILATIPKGGYARITHFTERFETDGYEWVQVEYSDPKTKKGCAGYCQLDTKNYLIKM